MKVGPTGTIVDRLLSLLSTEVASVSRPRKYSLFQAPAAHGLMRFGKGMDEAAIARFRIQGPPESSKTRKA